MKVTLGKKPIQGNQYPIRIKINFDFEFILHENGRGVFVV